jgi:hypothetical protein
MGEKVPVAVVALPKESALCVIPEGESHGPTLEQSPNN